MREFDNFPPEIHPANYAMKGNRPKERQETRVFLPDLTDDQLRKLAREKLSEALQAIDAVQQPELTRKLCAEVKDRLDGKPAQSLQLDANVNMVTVNATIRFADQPMVIEHKSTLGNDTQAIDNK